jgi:lipid II:glycine glycyltransferase (peptidoglycan interpeptide bridge formation enzyme)
MEVRKATLTEWRDFVNACPTATFFHTPDWYKVWKEYAGLDFEAKLIRFSSGREVLFPYCWQKRMKGFTKKYISSPAGTYGGFLYQEEPDEQEQRELLEYIMKFKNLQIRENPFQKIFDKPFWTSEDFTQVINLNNSWDRIFANWTKGHSSAAKKGDREGIEIRLAQAEDWPIYYLIYLDTIKKWKNPPDNPYSYHLFEKLQALSNKKCKLWIALYQDKIIAGCLCFYQNQHVVYWHGASLKEYYSIRPVHTLLFNIIKDAVDRNYHWFDFNPSGGHEGVMKFKKGFGVTLKQANVFQKNVFWLTLIDSANKQYSR